MGKPDKNTGLWEITFTPIDGNHQLIKDTNDEGIKIMDIDSTEIVIMWVMPMNPVIPVIPMIPVMPVMPVMQVKPVMRNLEEKTV